jgi:hypothetical protein
VTNTGIIGEFAGQEIDSQVGDLSFFVFRVESRLFFKSIIIEKGLLRVGVVLKTFY